MAIEKWELLRQKVVFEHPRLTLIEDDVRLPNGQETTYLRHKPAGNGTVIIPVDDKGRILIQREYSHPPAEVLYQFAGGFVPSSEDMAAGAQRELTEECGLRGDLEFAGSYLIDNRRTDAKLYVYIATNLQPAQLPHDAEEFIETEWLTEDEIDALIKSGDTMSAYFLASWMVYKSWKTDKKNTRN